VSDLGKRTRLNRIFSHPSGRIFTVAVDHWIGYLYDPIPAGLRHMTDTVAKVIEGQPDAITMCKGAVVRYFAPHAGKVPLIVQTVAVRTDGQAFFPHATVPEVLGLGADAIAVAVFIHTPETNQQMKLLADTVRVAERYGLPVVAHIYPIRNKTISHQPDDVYFAMRTGMELGVDLVKIPYTGDVASFRDIVVGCPVPAVAAGGPRCDTLDQAKAMLADVVRSGAAGATVGRNVWEQPDIVGAILTLKAVVHGG